jgi:uncharacterized repeat protein (TIGR03803 family)
VGDEVLRSVLAFVFLWGSSPLALTTQASAGPSLAAFGKGGTLAAFTPNGTGQYPASGVVQGPDGAFYGTTPQGGKSVHLCPGGCGTIYRVTAAGNLSVLHSFSVLDGAASVSELVLARDGFLYGTTAEGGRGGRGSGTIFRIQANGSGFRVIHVFEPRLREDGGSSQSPLIQAVDGALYGTTEEGTHGGIIFRINTNGSRFQILHTFDGTHDGSVPHALLQGGDGRLYGTTATGGSDDFGTVYALNPDGSGYTQLHQFSGKDGAFPESSLVEVRPGVFCSTTYGDGVGGYPDGTVFEIDADGRDFRTIHVFDGTHGYGPFGAMTIAPDGSLFGNTSLGGSHDLGTVFLFAPRARRFTILHNFAGAPLDGQYPYGLVLRSSSGHRLYGTTRNGGPNVCGASNVYCGTVYQLPM